MSCFFFGVLALLGVGTISWLLEQHRQDKKTIRSLQVRLTWLLEQHRQDKETILGLQVRLIPWNKGKKGYKQPRKPKQEGL